MILPINSAIVDIKWDNLYKVSGTLKVRISRRMKLETSTTGKGINWDFSTGGREFEGRLWNCHLDKIWI